MKNLINVEEFVRNSLLDKVLKNLEFGDRWHPECYGWEIKGAYLSSNLDGDPVIKLLVNDVYLEVFTCENIEVE